MRGELYPVSWSKIEGWQTCPRQYYEFRIGRIFERPAFEEQKWGEDVHTALEYNLVNQVPLANRFKQFEAMMLKLAKIPGEHFGEHKLGIDFDLNPVGYDDPTCAARCIIDRLIITPTDAIDLDYKTGKPKDVATRQLDLSSIIVGAHYPDVERIHSVFVWTQNGKTTRKVATREQLPRLWEGFLEDIESMEWSYKHNAWPPHPSGLCGPGKHSSYPGCPVLSCPHNLRPDARHVKKVL